MSALVFCRSFLYGGVRLVHQMTRKNRGNKRGNACFLSLQMATQQTLKNVLRTRPWPPLLLKHFFARDAPDIAFADPGFFVLNFDLAPVGLALFEVANHQRINTHHGL